LTETSCRWAASDVGGLRRLSIDTALHQVEQTHRTMTSRRTWHALLRSHQVLDASLRPRTHTHTHTRTHAVSQSAKLII